MNLFASTPHHHSQRTIIAIPHKTVDYRERDEWETVSRKEMRSCIYMTKLHYHALPVNLEIVQTMASLICDDFISIFCS